MRRPNLAASIIVATATIFMCLQVATSAPDPSAPKDYGPCKIDSTPDDIRNYDMAYVAIDQNNMNPSRKGTMELVSVDKVFYYDSDLKRGMYYRLYLTVAIDNATVEKYELVVDKPYYVGDYIPAKMFKVISFQKATTEVTNCKPEI